MELSNSTHSDTGLKKQLCTRSIQTDSKGLNNTVSLRFVVNSTVGTVNHRVKRFSFKSVMARTVKLIALKATPTVETLQS